MTTPFDAIRAAFALRKPCSPGCPGWAVFNADEGTPMLQLCDDCFRGVKTDLNDGHLNLLPEAVAELQMHLGTRTIRVTITFESDASEQQIRSIFTPEDVSHAFNVDASVRISFDPVSS